MYEQITYAVEDPVATITLSRPDSLNAWTNTMDVEVRDATYNRQSIFGERPEA